MSERLPSRSETVHVRAHTRGGRRGSVQVSAHDRSAPDRGDSDDRGSEPVYLHPGNVAKARQNMQDYLTFFRQNAARDKERGVDNGWQLAVDHLEHFLDGTGTPMALSSEQVARMPALISAEEDARIQLEQTFTANTKNDRLNAVLKGLADGAALELKDFWDTRTSSRHNRPRDYAAIGQSSVHSEIAFRVARKADLIMIEGEVTHRLGAKDPDPSKPNHYRDPYDFDANQVGSFPAITLEHAGEAKRFDMVSEPRRQGVTARVRVRPDGRLELDGPPAWGPIR